MNGGRRRNGGDRRGQQSKEMGSKSRGRGLLYVRQHEVWGVGGFCGQTAKNRVQVTRIGVAAGRRRHSLFAKFEG